MGLCASRYPEHVLFKRCQIYQKASTRDDVGVENETEIQRWIHLLGKTVQDRRRLWVS